MPFIGSLQYEWRSIKTYCLCAAVCHWPHPRSHAAITALLFLKHSTTVCVDLRSWRHLTWKCNYIILCLVVHTGKTVWKNKYFPSVTFIHFLSPKLILLLLIMSKFRTISQNMLCIDAIAHCIRSRPLSCTCCKYSKFVPTRALQLKFQNSVHDLTMWYDTIYIFKWNSVKWRRLFIAYSPWRQCANLD